MLKRVSSKPQGSYLDILCIGQKNIGTDYFLKQYTDQYDNSEYYKVFLKKILYEMNHPSYVYLHILNKQDDGLFPDKFDGIILFVHIKRLYKAQDTLIDWLDVEKLQNFLQKPIKIIVTGCHKLHKFQQIQAKEKAYQKLQKLVRKQQISFWANNEINKQLSDFFKKIILGENKELVKQKLGNRAYLEEIWLHLNRNYFRSQHHKMAHTQLKIIAEISKRSNNYKQDNISEWIVKIFRMNNIGKTKDKSKVHRYKSIKAQQLFG